MVGREEDDDVDALLLHILEPFFKDGQPLSVRFCVIIQTEHAVIGDLQRGMVHGVLFPAAEFPVVHQTAVGTFYLGILLIQGAVVHGLGSAALVGALQHILDVALKIGQIKQIFPCLGKVLFFILCGNAQLFRQKFSIQRWIVGAVGVHICIEQPRVQPDDDVFRQLARLVIQRKYAQHIVEIPAGGTAVVKAGADHFTRQLQNAAGTEGDGLRGGLFVHVGDNDFKHFELTSIELVEPDNVFSFKQHRGDLPKIGIAQEVALTIHAVIDCDQQRKHRCKQQCPQRQAQRGKQTAAQKAQSFFHLPSSLKPSVNRARVGK